MAAAMQTMNKPSNRRDLESEWNEKVNGGAGCDAGQSPLTLAMGGTHAAISGLHSAIYHLESRLSRALTPDRGIPCEADNEPEAVSPLVGEVEGINRSIVSATDRIEYLLSRLTV